MQRAEFNYDLPQELISQRPLEDRSASRLLCLDGATGALRDRVFRDLPHLLNPNDLLVVNDTQVVRARLIGAKTTGGRVEVLVERVLDDTVALAQVRASKSPRAGTAIALDGGARATVRGRVEAMYELAFDRPVAEVMAASGHVPLPPYIRRDDDARDLSRYQTVYADKPGAVAAPTAGLHFDAPLLDRLDALGVRRASVTLHVGAGTFSPVRADDVAEHRMHAERVIVDETVCEAVHETRARGGRVVAVGTTAVRSLETAAAGGQVEPFEGDTRLFIVPGFKFRAVDAMITNFHLPESTLLMLVCAFAGHGHVMAAYRHAVAACYRFFSYGDAMFVLPRIGASA